MSAPGAGPPQGYLGERGPSVYDLDELDSPEKGDHRPWADSPNNQTLQKLLEGVQSLLEGQQRLERHLALGAAATGSPSYAVEATRRRSGSSLVLRSGDAPARWTSEEGKDNPRFAERKSVVVDSPSGGAAPDMLGKSVGGGGASSQTLGGGLAPLANERLQSDDMAMSSGLMDARNPMIKSASALRPVRLWQELEGSHELFEQACAAALGDLEFATEYDLDEEDDHLVTGRSAVQSFMSAGILTPTRATSVAATVRGTFRRNMLVWGPASGTRATVDVLSIMFLMYDAFALPFMLGFDVSMEGTVLYNSMVVVLFWICDMLFRFRCSYFRQDTGTLETRVSMIARNYLKGTFLLDISIIAIDIVCIALAAWSASGKTAETDAFKFWRMGKVTRLARVTSLLRLRAMPALFERLSQNRTASMMHELLKLTLVIVWLNHVVACVWMPIGRTHGDTGMSWLDTDIGGGSGTSYRDGSTLYQYTTSFHWALTQMTPGSMQVFPVNSSERVFNCCCLLFGLLVFSTLVSSISATVTQFKLAMQKQGSMLDKLNQFLRSGEVSSELAIQVRQVVKEKLKYQKPLTIKDVEVLELLPLSLQNALQVQVSLPLVVKHGYFLFLMEADSIIVERICSGCCEPHGLMKQDTLFLKFTTAKAMYFVKHGELRYTSPSKRMGSTPTRSMTRPSLAVKDNAAREKRGEAVIGGDWLSEAALWCDWSHAGSAECFTTAPCEVMKLWTAKVLPVLTESEADLGAQLTFAYARSFAACLASHQDGDGHGEGVVTDHSLPFSVDEVMGAMPRKARLLMSHIAIRVIGSRTSGYFALTGQMNKKKMNKLAAEVKAGKCMVMLDSGSRLGVNRVVPLVVLKLWRDDGRILVEVKHASDPARVTAKLPGAKMKDGELPEQCLQRVLSESLGPELEEKLVRSGKESMIEMDSSSQYGIPTRYQKSIFLAQLDAGMQQDSETGSCAASPRNGTSDESAAFDPLQKDNLMSLESGHLGAWLTDDEINSFATPAGKAELSRRLVVAGCGPEPT